MKSKNSENENAKESNLSTEARGGFFEIRVKGHLDESWSDWLGGLEMELLDNGEMRLRGHIRDQAALMGILNKLYSLNLILLSLSEVNQKKLCRYSTQKETEKWKIDNNQVQIL
jgi:hypothetical protein